MSDFEQYRHELFVLAYRLLGSAMDAEDILQEAYLRYEHSQGVQALRPFLYKMVTNLCIDYLRLARVQREAYFGTWLPEPILTESPIEQVGQAYEKEESISIAFMVLLESLSPLERAVFILREVFDYDYAEIASTLNRSEEACRQVFSRAKKQLHSAKARFTSEPQHHAELVESFLEAAQTGNFEVLSQLLAEDATLVTDGGGKVSAAVHPLEGREAIMKLFIGLVRMAAREFPEGYTLTAERINGESTLVVRDHVGIAHNVISMQIQDQKIQRLYIIRNPEKLGHL